MNFHLVEQNLRQSFRALAAQRAKGDTRELAGVTIASLGVRFQMFNAAFLSGTVDGPAALAARLETASRHFQAEGRAWSLWVCEDWLSWTARLRLSRTCTTFGLRLSAELPGMITADLSLPKRPHTKLEIRRMTTEEDLAAFRNIGSNCFHVPPDWFGEVFDTTVITNPNFECWLAFLDGEPVATAATVPSDGSIGLYNIATAPGYRKRGIAEAITRHAATDARRRFGPLPLVLQSTSLGLPLYQRLGFRTVTRILVYVS